MSPVGFQHRHSQGDIVRHYNAGCRGSAMSLSRRWCMSTIITYRPALTLHLMDKKQRGRPVYVGKLAKHSGETGSV